MCCFFDTDSKVDLRYNIDLLLQISMLNKFQRTYGNLTLISRAPPY